MRPYYDEGGITIFHADCREILPQLETDVIISDPPYGIDAVLGMGGGYKGDGGMWADTRIEGDQSVELRDQILAMMRYPFAVFGSPRASRPPNTRAVVIWDKGEHTGAGDLSIPWKPSFEMVFIGGYGWSAARRTGGVIRVNAVAGCVGNRNDGYRHHPFEKPVAIMTHFCERAPLGVIVDPFCGSGSTLLAAKGLQRKAIGIEIKEEFCEAAADRLRQSVMNFGAAK